MCALNLEQAVEGYLEYKISLGLNFKQESWLLRHINKQILEDGRVELDAIAYEHWNNSIKDRHNNTRRKWQQIVYNFCLYRRRSDPTAFVPEAEGFVRKRPYVTPVIVEPEQISRMLIVATGLSSNRSFPLRGPCMRLAVVLLYTCGLRLGELLRLRLSDVEEGGRVLRIRESKFHRSRLIPLSDSAAGELRAYLDTRRAMASTKADAPLLCNRFGGAVHPYSHPGMQAALINLFDAAGVRDEYGRRPRVHDLRHSFALQALIRWYRQRADVQSKLPMLALYMGHTSIESSAYYLKWVPTLRQLASTRFEERFGYLVEGDSL
ncbi:tyrosine-type recombinase/integrase [Paraburkholderia oxyphila]|uniref:tyrosine-type recombinase/integrase n=1 Tax=Paraburkholderia oxyphila TaxID=614212 RepID=UPI0005B9A61B|nr:tyrosine-type recombinase/integrase [Paraburkholderia oxyphila]